MGKREVTQKEANNLLRWERFLEAQGGVYPSTLAAIKLRMTTAGVYQAGERGWLAFFQIGRDRWYGRKDIARYFDARNIRQGRNLLRSGERRDCTNDEDGGASRTWVPRDI
jgi:hypothetical protein